MCLNPILHIQLKGQSGDPKASHCSWDQKAAETHSSGHCSTSLLDTALQRAGFQAQTWKVHKCVMSRKTPEAFYKSRDTKLPVTHELCKTDSASMCFLVCLLWLLETFQEMPVFTGTNLRMLCLLCCQYLLHIEGFYSQLFALVKVNNLCTGWWDWRDECSNSQGKGKWGSWSQTFHTVGKV